MTNEAVYNDGSNDYDIYKWEGPMDFELERVYASVNQDGTVGGQAYLVDQAIKELTVTCWILRTDGVGPVDNIVRWKAVENSTGTITFFGNGGSPTFNSTMANVRLLQVRRKNPFGIGTPAGTNTYEIVEMRWMKEGLN